MHDPHPFYLTVSQADMPDLDHQDQMYRQDCQSSGKQLSICLVHPFQYRNQDALADSGIQLFLQLILLKKVIMLLITLFVIKIMKMS